MFRSICACWWLPRCLQLSKLLCFFFLFTKNKHLMSLKLYIDRPGWIYTVHVVHNVTCTFWNSSIINKDVLPTKQALWLIDKYIPGCIVGSLLHLLLMIKHHGYVMAMVMARQCHWSCFQCNLGATIYGTNYGRSMHYAVSEYLLVIFAVNQLHYVNYTCILYNIYFKCI